MKFFVYAASFLAMPFAWATEDDYQTNLSQRITNLRKKVATRELQREMSGRILDGDEVVECADATGAHILLSLRQSDLIYNNLGGEGPDVNVPEVVRYSNVGYWAGSVLDLVVSVDSGNYNTRSEVGNGYRCLGSTDGSSCRSDMGNINLFRNSEVTLKFELVDYLGTPVTVPAIQFSVYDVDKKGNQKEIVGVTGYEYSMYWKGAAPEANFKENRRNVGQWCNQALNSGLNCLLAESTKNGHHDADCDDPTSPWDIGQITCGSRQINQMKRSFQVDFIGVSSFKVFFKTTSGSNDRALQFALGPTAWEDMCTDHILPKFLEC